MQCSIVQKTAAVTLLTLLGAALAHGAVTWQPDRPVELVVASSAGSGQDLTARVMQRIIQEQGLVTAPVVVVNKPGGGGNVAYAYLKQHAGDGRFLATATATMLTNNILDPGSDNYTEFTPLSLLYNEYIGFAVNASSPLKTGRDLIERERKNPGATTFAFGTSLGNANHIGVALAMKAGGVDIRKLTIAIYKASAEATIALMGGHVDVVATPISTFAPMMQSGRLRIIAVAAPQRLAGVFAGVPTWKEQGVNAVAPSYRIMIGPRGMSPEQIAYWDSVFARFAQNDAWKKELAKNDWSGTSLKSADTGKYLDEQYQQYRAILGELGLAK
jgi:putative tricarboxylic transport membrane protein